MHCLSSCVEDDSFRRHVSIDDGKAAGLGRPGNIVDRSFFIEVNSRVKSAVRAQEVQSCFSIVALSGFVDLRLCQDDQGGTRNIPFELNLVTLEKVLLRDRDGEVRDVVDSDGGWLSLFPSVTVPGV